MLRKVDVAVIGGGSGGFAAALAAARLDASVLLVEKADILGGNAVRCGVNCWEPGAGGTGIPFDLYRRLKRVPNAIGIYTFGRHMAAPPPPGQPKYPGGESLIDPTKRYIDSLLRCGSPSGRWTYDYGRANWHGVPFEPEIMAQTQEAMLRETGRCEVLKRTGFTKVNHEGGVLKSVTLDNGDVVEAGTFVDGTADALLAGAAGATFMMGQESRAAFNEPDAPNHGNDLINAVTLIYRVARHNGASPLKEFDANGVPEKCWWRDGFPVTSVTEYPNGDLNMNTLPTMEGREFLGKPYSEAYAECRRRVLAQWRYMQTTLPEFKERRIVWIAPGIGVRETRRVVGDYVLTQNDLMTGVSRQEHPDIIAIADHSMDTHGQGNRRGGCGELREPYGVPLRCLFPRGMTNLLVACRGASFSSIAASSCRLTRTMMQLGQAAGVTASLAARTKTPARRIPAQEVRTELRRQHVQLEWPMSAEMKTYLANEDAP